jgi:hypothetical protein
LQVQRLGRGREVSWGKFVFASYDNSQKSVPNEPSANVTFLCVFSLVVVPPSNHLSLPRSSNRCLSPDIQSHLVTYNKTARMGVYV